MMSPFLREKIFFDKPANLDYAGELLSSKKNRETESAYVSLSHIPPTSNIVERLFSSAKLIYVPGRRSMLPENFEASLFLKTNQLYWNVEIFDSIYQSIKIK